MENETAYWWMMACSLVLTGIVFYLLARKNPALKAKAVPLALLGTLLSGLLGLLCAKLAYFLIRINYYVNLPSETQTFWLTLRPDQMSFFGGVAGVILAVFLTARLMKQPARTVLNVFAPAGALLIALSRFAEYFLGMLGVGELPEDTVLPFPLGVGIDFSGDGSYVEYYLAVFVLEGFAALIIACFALKWSKDPSCFVRTLFAVCVVQIFLESLRSSSISWLFVKAEQLFCFLFAEGVLLIRGLRARDRKGWWIPALIGLAVCAVIVAIEFALDKTSLSRVLLYAVMIVSLAALFFAERLSARLIASPADPNPAVDRRNENDKTEV